MLGRTTTWPSALIEKYPLPQASTWYKSRASLTFQAGLAATTFADVFMWRAP